jgi:putative hydrolase of the HAD superfamily
MDYGAGLARGAGCFVRLSGFCFDLGRATISPCEQTRLRLDWLKKSIVQMQQNLPELLLFDLGGVLIEVSTATLREIGGRDKSDVELWETWLTCPVVEEYESGRIGNAEFAAGVLKTFRSAMPAEEFLRSFASWPIGFYPGMTELLRRLRHHFKLAYLTNSNPLHYPRFQKEWQLDSYFDYHFASYKLGCVKPQRRIFELVLQTLPYKAKDIFFVDDNRLNVEAARSLGIEAAIARGPAELLQVLQKRGIVSPTEKYP